MRARRALGPRILWASLLVSPFASAPAAPAQEPPPTSTPASNEARELEAAAEQVNVARVTPDEAIRERLAGIFAVTGWFEELEVEVDQGVVLLRGLADEPAHRAWAVELAGNTEDVVAVVDELRIVEADLFDLGPAWEEMRRLAASVVRGSPLFVLALSLLLVTWLAAKATVSGSRRMLRDRFRSHLLRDVAARALAIPVFLVGLYLVLRISGLTGLAATVVGGTGLIGLIVGFAFRNIAENFLASVLLSVQHPFARGDLIEVAGNTGYVRSVNTRSTLLMTQDGNHVQIPNATIYTATIKNLTANPNARYDFGVGIGYDDSIASAQSVALAALQEHEAVLDEPAPLVLVEALGAATVNLRVYFWTAVDRFDPLKVRSSVIRVVKRALEEADISMPDEAREVVFPHGVPVRMLTAADDDAAPRSKAPARRTETETADDSKVHRAEGGLESDASEIAEQADSARDPEGGTDLLET